MWLVEELESGELWLQEAWDGRWERVDSIFMAILDIGGMAS